MTSERGKCGTLCPKHRFCPLYCPAAGARTARCYAAMVGGTTPRPPLHTTTQPRPRSKKAAIKKAAFIPPSPLCSSDLWCRPGSGNLHDRSVARTWLVTGLGEPCVAGKVGSVVLRVGQPVSLGTLVFQLAPLHDGQVASRPRHDGEQLVTTSQLPEVVTKGQPLDARFGPCCVSGPHLLCVLLNGAHVGGSPIAVGVAAAVPHARHARSMGPGGRANCARAASESPAAPPAFASCCAIGTATPSTTRWHAT